MSEFSKKVYEIVSKIPKGQTMSYKQVAEAAARPKAYRAVGNILKKNPNPGSGKDCVPCHRVIRSDGQPGGYALGKSKKIRLLKEEGAI
jgi:methylated-DNA-[protein]-cysteine S-methyltransferase